MKPNIDSVPGHYFNKHRSRNRLHRQIMSRYRDAVMALLDPRPQDVILDIGSGEGDLVASIAETCGAHFVCCDLYAGVCGELVRLVPNKNIVAFQADGAALPLPERCFEKVTCWQVLEHIEQPDPFLDSLRRVCRGDVYLSVPREPMWRVLNMLRGKYLPAWGNTPGHVQHWSAKGFDRLLRRHFREVKLCLSAPPFLLARCR